MSPTTTPDLQPLVAAQGTSRAGITAQAAAIAAASAAAFTGWYSTDQITDWAAGLVKVIEPLLRLLARNTDAYMARAVADVAGRGFRPVGAVDVSGLRSGVTHAGAYARAADTYRWQQSRWDQITRVAQEDPVAAEKMLGIQTPLQAAVNRATSVADMDTQLVVQQQSKSTLDAAGKRDIITGWRRVIHPELAIHGSCGLCIAISDRVYKTGELMPVHARCNCIPVPILNGKDPGSILNDGDLKRLYKDAGSTRAAGLKRTTYQVSDHGELGPVINDGTFRTPKRVRKATNPNAEPLTDHQRRRIVEGIHAELEKGFPQIQRLASGKPEVWGPYEEQMQKRITELAAELAA